MYEKIVQRKEVFTGRLLRLEVQEVETAGGARARREIVHHPGAVAVLAATPDDCCLLVRQFRAAARQVMIEIVAGVLEPGEEPLAAVRRELAEETGYRATRIIPVGAVYPTPGYCDERIDLFFARVDPAPGPRKPDEDEDLEVVLMPREQLAEAIAGGEIHDGKTLAAWALCERCWSHE